MPRKSKAEIELQTLRARYAYRIRLAELIANVIGRVVKWGVLAFIAVCAYWIVESLAGKTTLADIAVNFLSSMTTSHAIAYSAGGAGVLYGNAQKRLRKRTIKRLGKNPGRSESEEDPDRSSSLLDDEGNTNPKDNNE